MNKQLCFTALLMLSVLLSVSVACASDINVTDSYAAGLVDDTNDVSISNENIAGSSEILASTVSNVDNDVSKVSLSSEEVLGSVNSNTLSTNTNSNSVEDITNYATHSDDVVPSAISDNVASEYSSEYLTDDDNAKLAASLDENTNVDNNVILGISNVNTNINTVYSGGILIATLTDVNGNPISGAKVGFANNGVTYIRTDKNGQAKYSTTNLKDGTYTVRVKFYGDDVYSASNQAVAQITVNKVPTTLTSANVNVAYGGNGYLVATLKDANGKPISGAKVGFANNGVKYVLTDANGQAKYSTSGLAAGTYDVKMKFYGNDVYGASNQASAKITVSNVATILNSADVTVLYGANGYLVATLKDANGKAISGAKVGFANNGVKYIVTDANGQAKYSTSSLAPGTYTVKMKFYGNDAYGASNQASARIVVNNVATKLTSSDVTVLYGANGYLVATLTNANGQPIKGAKVGFANNGVKYIVTDANGQAKYSTSSLAPGTY
ncbi:Ig-like domain repeat protein, partial [Methanobrevibacter sp.]|uniref:Ig-like domain-containing protein n=1 Tax=Methanobrevibacter sp. TaxID=66852 RepID=UPI00388DD10F